MARPKLPWRTPLVFVPALNKEVWVRRLPWYDTPVLAISQLGDGVTVPAQSLTDPPTTVTITIPWIDIHTWKFRSLADEQAAFPPE